MKLWQLTLYQFATELLRRVPGNLSNNERWFNPDHPSLCGMQQNIWPSALGSTWNFFYILIFPNMYVTPSATLFIVYKKNQTQQIQAGFCHSSVCLQSTNDIALVSGDSWCVLVCFGVFWCALVCFSVIWGVLVWFGVFWLQPGGQLGSIHVPPAGCRVTCCAQTL